MRSDGFWMPLTSLDYIDDPIINTLAIGTVLNYWQRADGYNFPLCEKYFSEKTLRIRQEKTGKKPREMNFPSEGTVVRVEYNGLVRFYKYKSFAFKVMEGIIKEQDVIDPEEIS